MAGGVKWFGTEVMKLVEKHLEQGLDELANDIVKTAQESMREPKSGKDYRPKWRQEGKRKPKGMARGRARNVSSAPGEAPAVQYGDLIRSIQYTRAGKLIRHVGTNQKHGRYTELGTKHMKPRPWLRPAYKKHTGKDAEVHFEGKLP